MTEQELIRQCLENNRVAQRELYQHFASRMMAVCYRYARSREDAEEILQESFVKVFTQLKKFRGEGSFEGWIRKIVVNTALQQIRKDMHRMKDISFPDNLEVPGVHLSPSAEADELMDLIRQLPQGYRAVFNLYAIEGYAHKEIAEMLGINEGTSRSQYLRARAWLAKQLSPQLISHAR